MSCFFFRQKHWIYSNEQIKSNQISKAHQGKKWCIITNREIKIPDNKKALHQKAYIHRSWGRQYAAANLNPKTPEDMAKHVKEHRPKREGTWKPNKDHSTHCACNWLTCQNINWNIFIWTDNGVFQLYILLIHIMLKITSFLTFMHGCIYKYINEE